MILISKTALLMDMELEPDGWYKGRTIEHHVNSSPIVDAVPVVRCGYCKEAIECQLYGEHCGLPSEKGIFCEVWQTVVDKNGYCYQGAKIDAKEE